MEAPPPPVAPAERASTRAAIPGWVVDACAVFAGWVLLVGFELAVLATRDRALFAGSWELSQARRLVAPIALGALAPVAALASLAGHLLLSKTPDDPRARRAVALVCACAAGAAAYGVSTGRHLQAIPLRAAFVLALAVLGGACGYGAPWLLTRLSVRNLAAAAFFVAAAAWMGDIGILPRLYPAFHMSLFVVLLMAVAALGVAGVRMIVLHEGPGSDGTGTPEARATRIVLGLLLLVAGLSFGWAPRAARRLRLADNLRYVLIERTSLLARAVELAALYAPPPPLDEAADAAEPLVGEIPRALDWSGHDILLISVDALRADHVSAYGYARPTTPHVDALAREGTLFEDAYCPTPHTSYSLTSMMTGKAMRPLMTLGLGKGSETWAAQLRRYGYKTAAFYPPAVFYIDGERFSDFESSHLDFEYAKVQFATADERVAEVEQYLEGASGGPLFLWVHFFEPHEPYVMHPAYAYGGTDPKPIDAYDSEIAYVDAAIGEVVRAVRAKRPGVAILVTADHGEEFGEHGGRYHGTTCYEEQVKVPLIVVGPGVHPRKTPIVAQTIDLLPTVLSAIGTPRPARVQGRDLGPVLAGTVSDVEQGLAYAEAGDYAMVARGSYRLVCARRAGACRLYDVVGDPGEHLDMSTSRPQAAHDLRGVLAGIERETGRYEADATPWPDPIRRGLQRDWDAAGDAAALLDDANVVIRRKAAEVMFLLHPVEVAPETRRALGRAEDPEVQKWCALALVRMGDPPSSTADATLSDADIAWRRRGALAFASRGDARGAGELAAYWKDEAPPDGHLDVEDAKELLSALGRLRVVAAVPSLVASLAFVPLRPFVADVLGAIGDPLARGPLLELFAAERYENARPHEARALLALGAKREIGVYLARFAGLPEPMVDAIAIAREGGLLDPSTGGFAPARPTTDIDARLKAPPDGDALRLLVLAGGEGGALSGTVGGAPLGAGIETGSVHVRDLPPGTPGGTIQVHLHEPKGLLAAWVVRRVDPPVAEGGAADP